MGGEAPWDVGHGWEFPDPSAQWDQDRAGCSLMSI